MTHIFVRNDTRTPLEKDLGISEPGYTMPDGSFIRTRKVTHEMRVAAGVMRMKQEGCEFRRNAANQWEVHPPYPTGASAEERAQIDDYYLGRLQRALAGLDG